MKIEYDKEADALYISFKKAKIHMTVEKGKDIIEDFDEGGSVVGVEILDYSQKVSLPRLCFAVTFDDGFTSVLQAKKFLHRYRIRPALFVIADPTRLEPGQISSSEPRLNWGQIRSLARSGWEIGCHSLTHPDFSRLTTPQLSRQTRTAKKLLEKQLGRTVPYFAYPKGRFSSAAVVAVKASGFSLGLTVQPDYFKSSSHPWLLPRLGLENWVTPDLFLPFISPAAVGLRRLKSRL